MRNWPPISLTNTSKGGTDIAASVPGYLRMIFEVQQKLFFHLTTEWLPCGPEISRFPTRNPPRNALTGDLKEINATHAKLRHEMTSLFDSTTHDLMNFQLLLLSIPKNKLIWKLTICSYRAFRFTRFAGKARQAAIAKRGEDEHRNGASEKRHW